MQYLGIDISKAKFDVCLIDDTHDKGKSRTFSNDLEGFHNLLTWLNQPEAGALHICMEGTGRLWEPLAEFLSDRKFVVSVENPLRIRGFADSQLRRSKNDAIDARIIARFCKTQQPRGWVAPPPAVKSLRDLQRHLDGLKEDRTRQTNRLKSGVLDSLVIASLERHLSYLDAEIEIVEQQLREICSSDSALAADFEILTSIIGIGSVTATTLIGELGSLGKFEDSRQLELFCGVSPRVFQSGSSVKGRTCMSKRGNSRVRKALYMAALAAMRHNPPLREFADRLRAANKPGKVIVGAVMRKLLRIVYAVGTSRVPFDCNFRSNKPKIA